MSIRATGTVAFLMSDIEGSTRLIGVAGDAFPRLLDEHHGLMRGAITGHGGTVISTEGDSVFAVFPSAREAIAAATDAQLAIAAHAWPPGASVMVRIGIHAGEAVLRGTDYTGLEVHRTARIMAAASGGQVLISDAARALAEGTLPDGTALRDLGPHRLRDMPAAQHLYQLVAPGLGVDFPPLRTLTITTATNLPSAVTRFIGRTRELDELRALLVSHRLVTLTGPGGSGKTRLSVETARTLMDRFGDGVWFVALDAVRDPELVIPTIATTLHVPEQPGRPVFEVLAERLADQRTLLVLDNLEQVVEAAGEIAMLIGSAESLTILASSREPLSVAGEQLYLVPPLAVPAALEHPRAADIEDAGSIQLFVERARAARSDFSLTDENAPTIAAICRRLDGLPLAIELAAARINVLAADEILARLDQRLTLLASSRRDLPDRQRTLRGAIDWSHDLLPQPERVLFRRCSVFAGGMDLEAIERVVDPERELAAPVLDLTATLVDRSLLHSTRSGGAARLAMLETIREYAAERLLAGGDAADVEARHAAYYAAMGEAAANVMMDPRRDEVLDRFEREIGNLRATIAWSLRTGHTDVGLRMATGLYDFWHLRNHITEAVRALEELIASSIPHGDTILRARGLLVAGGLLTWLAEAQRSRALSEQGIAMAERLGDLPGVAIGKSSLGWSIFYSEPTLALDIFGEARAAARSVGDRTIEMESMMGQSWTHLLLGRSDVASALATEVIELGDRIGAPYITAFALVAHGILAAERGDMAFAVDRFGEALRRAHAAGAHVGTSMALDGFASIAIERGDVRRGARLAAAADRLRDEIGSQITFTELGREQPLARARRLMEPADLERAVGQGRELSADEAVALALEVARAK
jgi:predicted ATPase/class 3 adenylate cyclase